MRTYTFTARVKLSLRTAQLHTNTHRHAETAGNLGFSFSYRIVFYFRCTQNLYCKLAERFIYLFFINCCEHVVGCSYQTETIQFFDFLRQIAHVPHTNTLQIQSILFSPLFNAFWGDEKRVKYTARSHHNYQIKSQRVSLSLSSFNLFQHT